MKISHDFLISLGFTPTTNLAIGTVYSYNLGRRRLISISGMGTPNEMTSIMEIDTDVDPADMVTDVVILFNFDYDGPLLQSKVQALVDVFKG
jgi:hypothetical protein